ncbi:MAG: UDP-N-acetylmuramate--L-alanine ligase [Clostridia bacterium]|nr:UDP-N-acetylmuramate--L-alanine ligase [Clostridia bacterium]
MCKSSYYSPAKIAELLQREKNVFFIGIGGVSMSSLAEIAADKGYAVSGSDRAPGEVTEALKKHGVTVYEGHDERHCIGSTVFVYNAAIHEDNPEYAYAKRCGYPLIRRADFLGYVVTFFGQSVGVAGTHGKSTSTAMLGSALIAAGLDPTVLNGAVMRGCRSSYRRGDYGYLCFEACEYTDSFLSFFPTVATVLNVGFDHADYFHTQEKYNESFAKYISQSPCAVVNIDSANAKEAVKGYKGRLITCGRLGGADVYPENIDLSGDNPEYDAYYRGELYAHIKLGVPGLHNVDNSLCVIGACIMLGVDGADAAAGIEKFEGVARRFEFKGKCRGADVYDDYAHHPDEIKATLAVARRKTKGRVYTAFQPHTYSRTSDLYDGFINAFEDCDEVVFCDIYAARETDTLGMSAQKLAADTENGSYKGGFDDVAAYLRSVAGPGDTVVVMGAGDVTHLADLLKE